MSPGREQRAMSSSISRELSKEPIHCRMSGWIPAWMAARTSGKCKGGSCCRKSRASKSGSHQKLRAPSSASHFQMGFWPFLSTVWKETQADKVSR